MQKSVAAQPEVDERRLDRRLDVGDAALVDIADVSRGAGPLHVKLFEHAVFQEGDSAFLALGDVDQHFFCHCAVVQLSGLGHAWISTNRT